MDKVISLLSEPIFWFATVLVSIVTGVTGNYLFKFIENLRIKYNEKFRDKRSLEYQQILKKAKKLSESKEDLILESIEKNSIYYEITIQLLWIFACMVLSGFLYINFEKFNSFLFFSMLAYILYDVYKLTILYKKLIYSNAILQIAKRLISESDKDNKN